jgi:RNA polymerase sigma-70 factor (ECF subfamily)
MTAADEQHIIEQAKDGNRDAFRLLMGRYIKRAYNVAYRFVGNHDAAEDITQETFVKVHAAIKSFRGDSEFGTWLYGSRTAEAGVGENEAQPP